MSDEQLPADLENPARDKCGRVHNWKNYVSSELQEMWNTFTTKQKAAIYRSADDAAGREEWE